MLLPLCCVLKNGVASEWYTGVTISHHNESSPMNGADSIIILVHDNKSALNVSYHDNLGSKHGQSMHMMHIEKEFKVLRIYYFAEPFSLGLN